MLQQQSLALATIIQSEYQRMLMERITANEQRIAQYQLHHGLLGIAPGPQVTMDSNVNS